MKENLWIFRENLWFFRENLWFFRENLWIFKGESSFFSKRAIMDSFIINVTLWIYELPATDNRQLNSRAHVFRGFTQFLLTESFDYVDLHKCLPQAPQNLSLCCCTSSPQWEQYIHYTFFLGNKLNSWRIIFTRMNFK